MKFNSFTSQMKTLFMVSTLISCTINGLLFLNDATSQIPRMSIDLHPIATVGFLREYIRDELDLIPQTQIILRFGGRELRHNNASLANERIPNKASIEYQVLTDVQTTTLNFKLTNSITNQTYHYLCIVSLHSFTEHTLFHNLANRVRQYMMKHDASKTISTQTPVILSIVRDFENTKQGKIARFVAMNYTQLVRNHRFNQINNQRLFTVMQYARSWFAPQLTSDNHQIEDATLATPHDVMLNNYYTYNAIGKYSKEVPFIYIRGKHSFNKQIFRHKPIIDELRFYESDDIHAMQNEDGILAQFELSDSLAVQFNGFVPVAMKGMIGIHDDILTLTVHATHTITGRTMTVPILVHTGTKYFFQQLRAQLKSWFARLRLHDIYNERIILSFVKDMDKTDGKIARFVVSTKPEATRLAVVGVRYPEENDYVRCAKASHRKMNIKDISLPGFGNSYPLNGHIEQQLFDSLRNGRYVADYRGYDAYDVFRRGLTYGERCKYASRMSRNTWSEYSYVEVFRWHNFDYNQWFKSSSALNELRFYPDANIKAMMAEEGVIAKIQLPQGYYIQFVQQFSPCA